MLQRPEISISLFGHLAHIFLTYMHRMFWDTVLNNYQISKIRNADSVAGIIKHYVFLGKTLPSQCLKLSPLTCSYFLTRGTRVLYTEILQNSGQRGGYIKQEDWLSQDLANLD